MAEEPVGSRFDEERGAVVHLVSWTVLGIVSGLLAGVSSFVFLDVLDRATRYRVEHHWIVWILPLAGLAIGLVYHYVGGDARRGTALLIDEIHEPSRWVPRRMAPLVLIGTWTSHLFGASVGREGTALQMSASLTDNVSRILRVRPTDRRILLSTALAAGFGAVFGVPLAGAVFALEVQTVGRIRYEALVPGLAASVTGNLVVGALGYEHAQMPMVAVHLSATLALRIAIAGVAFGLAGAVFAWLTHSIKRFMERMIRWAPLRPAAGGIALIGLAALAGRDYLGLSIPIITRSVSGEHVGFAVFALKLVFTAVALGCSFPGGEVTPLFVIGSSLGAALSSPLHVPVTLLAAVGFVAVFAGASNTPLACSIMAVELFGGQIAAPAAIGCVVAYVFSRHQGIYATQRHESRKHHPWMFNRVDRPESGRSPQEPPTDI
ncbi:MAG: chloride channel protein [Acidimicrobiia bacterium]